MSEFDEFLRNASIIILVVMGTALLLALLLLNTVRRRAKKLNIPPDAGFNETLRMTPLIIVVFIDLLDLGLDFLAAPISWVLLDRWGLKALRNVSALEAIVPFTQAVPTLTAAWMWVRLTDR